MKTESQAVVRDADSFCTDSIHLRDLNPAQRQAVEHALGPLLVFAGAGSGKTRVLTRRIAHLVLEHGVHPEQILAVTFTNKAAAEMKRRVGQLFFSAGFATPSWVATFHSACVRILRAHAQSLDFTSQFAIYDSSDTFSLLKRAYETLKIDSKMLDPRYVMSRIDRAKNDYKDADAIRNDTFQPSNWKRGANWAEMIADLFNLYQEGLRQANAMDFGDLLCNTVTLFKLEPKILEQYQDRFQHLLIDEYQDTNRVQYLLISMLAAKQQNLCVVGDDDQSIYSFRGASVENILRFQKDFPHAAVVTLDTNYRSSKTILDAANAIIAANKNRQHKVMKTPNDIGEPVQAFCGYDEKHEAEYVVREIVNLLKKKSAARDIAIFYRTNAQSRAIEEALCEQGLPYEIYGGFRFYERKEIKDITSYLRLLLNPQDNEAFLRVINTPARGLGAKAIGELIAFANKTNSAFLPALEQGITENAPFLSGATKNRFKEFIALIEKLREAVEVAKHDLAGEGSIGPTTQKNAIATLLQAIAEKTGYLSRLKSEDSPESQSRIENIHELFVVAIEFVDRLLQEGQTPELIMFLERVSLASDLDKENRQLTGEKEDIYGGTISLMTLHLAKGLEFDNVFLVGLEEGLLPHVRALDNPNDLEEERRLCYVGITRAKRRLHLSRVTSRQTFGRGGWYSGYPSRFIDDLPMHIVDDRGSGFFS